MISQRTIDAVRELDLVQVISQFVTLKQSGANYMGKSPFVEEKTASFSVSPSKGVYKCFSSGKGGNNPISFVMELKGVSYIEAIKLCAELQNIPIEHDDSESSKKYVKRQEAVREISEINQVALEFFESKLSDVPEKELRYPIELLQERRIGYAPDSFDALISHMLQKGFSKQQLVKTGLAKENADKTKIYSFFRGRIMFPIFTSAGVLIGFSGRDILPPSDKKNPKYLNSSESDAYSKMDSLYGISFAKESIRKAKHVYKVEGNFDVIALNHANIPNVVAPLGTAFTPYQAKELRKFADAITLFIDNDKAGLKALNTDVRICLEVGFDIRVFIPTAPVDEEGNALKIDADDLVRSATWKENEFEVKVQAESVDAVEYMAELFFKDANTVPQKSKAETELSKLIALIPNQKIRSEYIKTLSKTYGIDKKSVESEVSGVINEKIKEQEEEKEGFKLPTYIGTEGQTEFKDFMFYEDPTPKKIGYYFPGQSGSSFERITNFLIRPIFQLGSASDGGRVCEISNGKKSKVKILPKDAFNNPAVFENELSVLGDFRFDGTKKHLQKLRAKIYPKFVMHEEITSLGWHRDGFWAFANGIIDNGFKEVDKFGSVHFGDKHYYLPAFSSINEELPEENDSFASDRKNVYRADAKINVSEWAYQMFTVYNENGIIAVSFVLAAVFRDFIYEEQHQFPILFMFGRPFTGKTKCSISISSIFFSDTTPFNLNNGTTVGFQRKLAAVKNAIVHLDEYTNSLDEKKFQSLKGVFDGTGHEAGVKESSNRTKTTRINSSAVISGQYMPTIDDASLLSRSILCAFTKTAEEFTEEEKRLFEDLSKTQAKGLSHLIVEMIKYRDLIVENFVKERYIVESGINKEVQGKIVNGRVIENYATILTVYKLLCDQLRLPVKFDDFRTICVKNILRQSSQLQETNTLTKFWKTIEFMTHNNQLSYNVDFRVEARDEIRIRFSDKDRRTIQLGKDTRVLYIKLNKAHPLYMEITKRQKSGEEGIPFDSLKSYLKSDKSYIGPVAKTKFNGGDSSAYAFRYDLLGVHLHGVHMIDEDDEYDQQVAVSYTNETLDKISAENPDLFDQSGNNVPF